MSLKELYVKEQSEHSASPEEKQKKIHSVRPQIKRVLKESGSEAESPTKKPSSSKKSNPNSKTKRTLMKTARREDSQPN